MFSLCTVTSTDLQTMYGTPDMPGQSVSPRTVDFDLIMIGQAPDASSYLVLSPSDHELLVKQTSVPTGYDFIFRQSWGLTINEDIIHRVIQTLRAEAYPPMADYLDAKVKGDITQEQTYLRACAAVKVKYPKFSF
jgi:hypothetical protein